MKLAVGVCRKGDLECSEEPLLQNQANLCISPGFHLLIVVNSEEVVELLDYSISLRKMGEMTLRDHTCKYELDRQKLLMLFVKDQRSGQGPDQCPVDVEVG